ncbi:cation transporting ATPase [Naviculisporaceae sp. PSN 640]
MTNAATPESGVLPASDEHGPFAFSTSQLSKLINPKSIETLTAYGGLAGLEKGLRTDRLAGLSIDETHVTPINFRDAVTAGATTTTNTRFEDGPSAEKSQPLARAGTRLTTLGVIPQREQDQHFVDRKAVFGENRLPERKSKSFLQLAWIAMQDRVLILLSVAAAVSLALGLYQTFSGHRSHESDGHGGAKVEWVEGLAIIVAILIVVLVGALNDWQKERQFRELNRKKQDRLVKAVRSGRPGTLSVYDVLVGDVLLLEQGDILPVDGVLIDGHNISCDEASATGESDIVRKTPAGENMKPECDPFVLSGTKVLEGVGSFLVTAVGPNSSHGRTMVALRDDPGMTPLQIKLNIMAGYIAKLGSAAGLFLFTVLFIEFLVRLPGDDASPEEKAQQFLRILVTAITIIVVAVPEGLPLAVTLSLAFATKRMTKENNLVRHLQSCETMGNATVICSDKTGTLTENVMTVVAGTLGANTVQFNDRPNSVASAATSKPQSGVIDETVPKTEPISSTALSPSLNPQFSDLVKESIAVNTTAFEGEEKGQQAFVGSKTETALLDWARKAFALGPLATERANRGPIVHLFPFDSTQKCMGTVIRLHEAACADLSEKKHGPKFRLLIKGAPEMVLSQCTWVISDPRDRDSLQTAPLEPDLETALGKVVSGYASQSLRTLALAYRDFDHWPPLQKAATLTVRDSGDDEDSEEKATETANPTVSFDSVLSSLTWLAVVGIQDPVREGVPAAVATCHRASVSVKMVTGDNMETARAIALECGILKHKNSLTDDGEDGLVMDGPTFRTLPPDQQIAAASKLLVLARSSPEDKRLLVQTLRNHLHQIVAVTGDGTNDAPALKAADVGFSMGITGTEVAKEASDIILMDDNFTSIVKALAWGRAINDAIKKFLQFQLTVNITAVALTFISAVASNDERSVLNAIQLLWVNLIMDTFAALALATDPPTESLLNRPPDPKKTAGSLVTLTMWKMIIGQSIYQLAVGLTLHFAGPSSFLRGYEQIEQRTLVFNAFVFMQIFKLVNSRRIDNKLNIFEGLSRNRLFMLMMGTMVLGQVLIIEFGAQAFDVVPLNGVQWGISIVLGFLSIPVGLLIRLFPDSWTRAVYEVIVLVPWRLLMKLVRCCLPSRCTGRGKQGESREDEEEAAAVVTQIRPSTSFKNGKSAEEAKNLQEALYSVRDDLRFLKTIKGGRIRAFGETLMAGAAHTPCGTVLRRPSTATSATSRPMKSAMGMPGLLAASIGGLGSLSDQGHSSAVAGGGVVDDAKI